jgi:hypothetical protein
MLVVSGKLPKLSEWGCEKSAARRWKGEGDRLNMEFDHQSLLGLQVYMCTAVLIGSYTRALLVNKIDDDIFL